MKRRQLRLIFWLLVMPGLCLGILALSRRAAAPYVASGRAGLPEATRAVMRQVYATVPAAEEAGHSRLNPDDPGGWLSVFPEEPQTFADYVKSRPVTPGPGRRTIVLQPLGPMTDADRRVLAVMAEYAQAFFQLPARVAPPLPLPASGLPRSRPTGRGEQWSADHLLDVLEPRLPADAAVYLGVTMADLWSGDLNFVFGLGSYGRRLGVYSLARYYPEFRGRKREPADERLGLERACKVLNHEAGHILGLSHCVFYHCSMNGSNSLLETDAAPLHYCPACDRKLLWNVRCDPARRLGALEAFYRKHGMAAEADWTAKRRPQPAAASASQRE